MKRREAILYTFKTAGSLALGGIVWSSFLKENANSQIVLRPPGAKNESEFLKSCIKCGLCTEACPYDTLSLAKLGSNVPVGTPFFTPRSIPCYMCVDFPCVPICPTDALDTANLGKNPSINASKMGLAVVDTQNCVAFWGIQCDACYRACPLIDKAIVLEYKRNERTGKHSFLLPVVDSNFCTGCGKCEHACITEKAAIFVLPLHLAQGKVGTNYIKGWEQKDEQRLEKSKAKKPKSDVKRIQDYLNEEEF